MISSSFPCRFSKIDGILNVPCATFDEEKKKKEKKKNIKKERKKKKKKRKKLVL